MSNRKVEICYSDDGGHNWSNWREASLGEIGQYGKRVRFNRFGTFRNRVWKIRVASPVKRDLLGAVAYMTDSAG